MATSSKRPTVIVVDLQSYKQPWLDWCASNRVRPSEALRQIVAKLTASVTTQSESPGAAPTVAPRATEKGRVRRVLRLTMSEDAMVQHHAEAAGYSVTRWILAIIRTQLRKMPEFGHHELAALVESNYQLVAIGRNLNQIAHALNANRGSTAAYDEQIVHQLRHYIERHTTKVGQLIEASTQRWA